MSLLKSAKELLSKGATALKKGIDSIPDKKLEQIETSVKKESVAMYKMAKGGIKTLGKAISEKASDLKKTVEDATKTEKKKVEVKKETKKK